jgi:hypothetical protein
LLPRAVSPKDVPCCRNISLARVFNAAGHSTPPLGQPTWK